MKTNNLSPRNPEQPKSEFEDIITFKEGIMKVLLEKYRPKVLYDFKTTNARKVKRIVA